MFGSPAISGRPVGFADPTSRSDGPSRRGTRSTNETVRSRYRSVNCRADAAPAHRRANDGSGSIAILGHAGLPGVTRTVTRLYELTRTYRDSHGQPESCTSDSNGLSGTERDFQGQRRIRLENRRPQGLMGSNPIPSAAQPHPGFSPGSLLAGLAECLACVARQRIPRPPLAHTGSSTSDPYLNGNGFGSKMLFSRSAFRLILAHTYRSIPLEAQAPPSLRGYGPASSSHGSPGRCERTSCWGSRV